MEMNKFCNKNHNLEILEIVPKNYICEHVDCWILQVLREVKVINFNLKRTKILSFNMSIIFNYFQGIPFYLHCEMPNGLPIYAQSDRLLQTRF